MGVVFYVKNNKLQKYKLIIFRTSKKQANKL